MVGLDTNVLARFLVRDDEARFADALIGAPLGARMSGHGILRRQGIAAPTGR